MENKDVKILVGLPDTDKQVMVIRVNIVVVENEENRDRCGRPEGHHHQEEGTTQRNLENLKEL